MSHKQKKPPSSHPSSSVNSEEYDMVNEHQSVDGSWTTTNIGVQGSRKKNNAGTSVASPEPGHLHAAAARIGDSGPRRASNKRRHPMQNKEKDSDEHKNVNEEQADNTTHESKKAKTGSSSRHDARAPRDDLQGKYEKLPPAWQQNNGPRVNKQLMQMSGYKNKFGRAADV